MKGAHPQVLRGIGLMVLAVSTFSCLDATSKYLATQYPVPAIVWARYVFQVRAHEYAPASVLGPFMYGQLLTALALGWLVFGQLPDGLSMVGMLVVTASGLLLILSHRR